MINPTYAPFLYNPQPVANQTIRPRQSLMFAFQQELSAPPKPTAPVKLRLVRDMMLHPLESFHLLRNLRKNLTPGETFGTRLAMYRTLCQNLTRQGRNYLYQLLLKGGLTDTRTDTHLPALSYLYDILVSPKAPGLQAANVLENVLRCGALPHTIDQKFAPLKPKYLQMMSAALGPNLVNQIGMEALRTMSSATCVASSKMYSMAADSFGEFARHIAGLTSPRQAFYEKASCYEISPEDPARATEMLQAYGVPYTAVPGSNGSQFWIKVDLPHTGLIRALNQQESKQPGTQSVVESVYQAALTHLVTRNYDPGLDMRVNPDGTLDTNKGLDNEQMILMSNLINDNKPVLPVTYQLTIAGQDDEPYLMGYYRNFDQTANDLIQALDLGEKPLIGIVDTEVMGPATGRLGMKHELKVVGYERDRRTGQPTHFIIQDSDDNQHLLEKRPIHTMVPMIHHAELPVSLAQRVFREMDVLSQERYLVPGPEDAQRYALIPTVPPQQQPAFMADFNRRVQAEEAATAQSQGKPQPTQSPAMTQPPVMPWSVQPTVNAPGWPVAPATFQPAMTNPFNGPGNRMVPTASPYALRAS